MAEKSLEHLAELNEERKNYIYSYLGRERERYKVFDKEHEFLDFAEAMAEVPAVKGVILETLEDADAAKEVKLMACYVGFLTGDEVFWKQMIPVTIAIVGTSNFPLGREVLSLLPDSMQATVVAYYLRDFKCDESFRIVGDTIFNNALFELAEAYVDGETLLETKGVKHIARKNQALLAMRGDMRVLKLMEVQFDTCDDQYIKDTMVPSLILATSQKAFDYAKTSDDEDLLEYLVRYGGPADMEAIAAFIDANVENNTDSLNQLSWCGNPKAIPWFVKNLSTDDPYRRKEFHRLILYFFDEEGDIWKEGEELLEFDPGDEENFPSASEFQAFWNARKEQVEMLLDANTRYYGSDVFDMRAIWAYEEYSDRRGFVRDRRKLLMIWTGEYFAFDEHALITKQLEQYRVIEAWLEANKTRFRPGRWYRWGVDITDETPSALPKRDSGDTPTAISGTAPRTGRYRATLPEGHPQYEALKTDPQAYRTYKEDERFSNAGLEAYDGDRITWIFIED